MINKKQMKRKIHPSMCQKMTLFHSLLTVVILIQVRGMLTRESNKKKMRKRQMVLTRKKAQMTKLREMKVMNGLKTKIKMKMLTRIMHLNKKNQKSVRGLSHLERGRESVSRNKIYPNLNPCGITAQQTFLKKKMPTLRLLKREFS